MKPSMIMNVAAYLPRDRRFALASKAQLPDSAAGAALFADLSGFTPLTEAYVRFYGPQLGAEETTRSLNLVYTRLIEEIHRFGGSVVGFSGDGLTCWFDGTPAAECGAAVCAVACAQALHGALAEMAQIEIGEQIVTLGLKVAISAGSVRRMAVGDPSIHLVDAIAGAPISALGWLEGHARPGQTVVDAKTAALLGHRVLVDWQELGPDPVMNGVEKLGVDRMAVIRQLVDGAFEASAMTLLDEETLPELPEKQMRSWIQPAVYARIRLSADSFLAELRPAVALFLRFDGLDFETDPDAPRQLDRLIRWVQKVLAHYDGTLIQLTTGDKGSYLYAVFGAPTAHDNDIIRAVGAALVLRKPPADLNLALRIQIGLAQGRMRVGPYGGDRRRTYGVQGPAVNLAARLMMHARPDEILLDKTVAAGARSLFPIEALGTVPIKGKGEPEPVYTVAEMTLPERIAPTLVGHGFLFGRTKELACIVEFLEQARAGKGQLVRIAAEAGLGKSRIMGNFAQHAATEQLFLSIAACQITTRDTAYYAARQIGHQLFGLKRTDLTDDAARIGQVAALLQQLNPDLLPRMPLLGAALELPIPDNETTARLEPKLRREAFLTLTQEILRELTQVQPVVILVEDIHWLDEASADLLASLVRPLADMRLLIVASHRPPSDYSAALLTRIDELPNQHKIVLSELDETAVAALATERLGARLTPLALDFVQAQAQGNPFFIEELLYSLQETGDLRLNETGSWDLAPPFIARLQAAHCLERRATVWRLKAKIDLSAADIGLPDSIHGIVLARLDRLPEAIQLTVKTASVIGRVFEGEVLRRAHPQGLDATELAGQLATLEARDFARVETVDPEPVYLFKHNITQEVAYQTLLDRQRRQLHQTVGETLERLQPMAVERLALHFYHSDTTDSAVREKAVHYLDGAARRAKREYANETALTYLQRASGLAPAWTRYQDKVEVLHILGRREEERGALEALTAMIDTPLVAAQLLWGEYYDAVSDYDAARQAVARALKQSRADADRLAEARCHSRLGLIAWRLGDYEQARREYIAGLDALQDFDHAPVEEAEIRYGLGLIWRQQGDYGAAITEFARTLDLYRLDANRYGEAQLLKAIGLTHKHLRDLDQALAHYTQSLELYRLIGAKGGESECLLNMAEVYSLDGAHDRAATLLERALEIQQDLNNAWWQLRILNGLGIVNMLTGRHEAALRSLQTGLEFAVKLGDESGRAYLLCNVGQVYGHLGKPTAAAQVLDEGHALAVQQQDRHLQALIQSELGILAIQRGDAATAIVHAGRAIGHLRELGLGDSLSSDLATMAQGHLHLGELDRARACVDQILAMPQAVVEKNAAYPQRDYFICYSVLRRRNEADEARSLLETAWQILRQRAERLVSEETRTAFLTNLACNQAILKEAARMGIGGAMAKTLP